MEHIVYFLQKLKIENSLCVLQKPKNQFRRTEFIGSHVGAVKDD